MKKLVFAAAMAVGLAGTAPAAVLTLQDIARNGASNFTFSYQATLNPDEGLRAGDRFVVFDFAGYIDGSIFSNSSDFSTRAENTTSGALVTPGYNDDAQLTNLVFTYTGPDTRSVGPLASLNLPLIGARSIFGQTVAEAFFTLTTKNNPPRDRGSPIYTLGSTSVPGMMGVIPEPATWAMLIGGFGLVGAAARRRTAGLRVTA